MQLITSANRSLIIYILNQKTDAQIDPGWKEPWTWIPEFLLHIVYSVEWSEGLYDFGYDLSNIWCQRSQLKPIHACEKTGFELLYTKSKHGDIVICSICVIIKHINIWIFECDPPSNAYIRIYKYLNNPPFFGLALGLGQYPHHAQVMYLKFFLIFYILNHIYQ